MRDQKRLQQVGDHIRRIKAADYPVMVGTPDNYRIEERPWKDLAESSKLAILQGAVDWSGVSNRDQAHILLAEIDPGKITDAQRNRLIGMATRPPSVKEFFGDLTNAAEVEPALRKVFDLDRDEGFGR